MNHSATTNTGIRILLAFLICISLINRSYAQTTFCPPNIDFEMGNLGVWEFYSGSCCPINTPTPGVITNRHTLTSGTGVDPVAGFPVVAPNAGMFSVKLGNQQNGAQAERARYYINVPVSAGTFILSYRYAVVFEDPSHSFSQQPRFEIRAYDSATGSPLPCSQYTYVSSSNIPGFVRVANTNRYYLPWTTGTINLTQFKGQTIAIDFAAGDCSLGGHFGYGYIDMNCGLFEVTPTKCDSNTNNITFNGPPGYQSYQWRDSALVTILGNNQSLTIPAPPTPKVYAVIVTPYPGFGCRDTIYTTYKTPVNSNTAISSFADTSICEYDATTLAPVVTGSGAPFTYQWTPSTGLSCNNCASPTVNALTTTQYVLAVTNSQGCTVRDTIVITVDTVEKAAFSASKDSICQRDSTIITNTNPKSTLNTSQVWDAGGGTILSGGGSNNFIEIYWPTPGNKRVMLTSTKNLCSYTDTIFIFVKPDYTLTMPVSDTICTGEQLQLTTANTSGFPLTYNWKPSTFLSCTDCPDPVATPTTTTQYKLIVNNQYGCYDSGLVKITVDTTTFTTLEAVSDSICLNKSADIVNTGNNPVIATYIWGVDTGQITYGAFTDSINVFWGSPGYKTVKLRTIQGICTSSDSIRIYVIDHPYAFFEVSSIGCINEPVEIFPEASNGYYHWTIPGQNITDSAFRESYKLIWNSLGTNKIELTLTYLKCSTYHSKELTIYPHPIAEIAVDNRNDICKGKEFQLHATKGNRYTYSWQPALSFSTNSSPDVTARAERTELYTLKVTNQWGCSSYDSVRIDATPCCDIFMPDAFTPNNDGHNDSYWSPDIDKHTLVRLMIANRRGQIVYDSKTQAGSWDGTYKGEPAGQDTYNYYIQYLCNGKEEMTKKGTIILLR